jgi:hypothetical protein
VKKTSRRNLYQTSAERALSAPVARSDEIGATPKPIGVRPKTAARMGLGGLTNIYKLLNEGAIESYRIGRARFVTVASIEALIAKRVAEAQAVSGSKAV